MKKSFIQKINSWHFLTLMIIIYFSFSIFDLANFIAISKNFYQLALKIIPLLVLIFITMVLANKFISPKIIQKHIKDNGYKKWFYIVIGGVLSSGPIYMWYPVLKDLQEKGLSYGCIVTFLYNRAIKITLLPVAFYYFDVKYIIILSVAMAIASVLQGLIINKFFFTTDPVKTNQ